MYDYAARLSRPLCCVGRPYVVRRASMRLFVDCGIPRGSMSSSSTLVTAKEGRPEHALLTFARRKESGGSGTLSGFVPPVVVAVVDEL